MNDVLIVKLDSRYITSWGDVVAEPHRAHRFVDTERETALVAAQRVAAYRARCCPPARVVRIVDGVEHDLA